MPKWVAVGIMVAALLIGLLGGYLYWGRPLGSVEQELARVRVEAEAEREALTRSLRETEGRLKTAREEQERLEQALAEGRK
ncbi:MAG: hypothetical protein HYV61_11190 [Candidatus Rokubacteria bacterium]|nr:hypothetical protein [Candidatus Rokubacteria bacterium]MBI2879841.1 hypothetical protein [Candidatus Rokubacteria bacterium]